MKHEKIEAVHGSGNVFRDFGLPDADRRQLRAVLAAHVLKILDRKRLTARSAETRTGIAAADFPAFAIAIFAASQWSGSSR